MKISRDSRKLARNLFRLAINNGRLDPSRIKLIADAIVDGSPRGGLSTLKEFTRLVRLELASRRAVIESATPLDAVATATLRSAVTSRFGPDTTTEFRVDSGLIGGTRVQVGSDVWDGTVRARLESLSKNI